MCLTDENQLINKNNNINETNINGIKVCISKELKIDEKKLKNFKRDKSCKKPYEIRESLRDSTSIIKIRYKNIIIEGLRNQGYTFFPLFIFQYIDSFDLIISY